MKRNFLGAMIALAASAILFSCEEPAPEPKPVPLATPVVSVSEQTETSFVIAWEAVEHAVSYVYSLNDGAEQNTSELSATFTDLTEGTYNVKVKAIAPEGEEYLDSDWATVSVTIEAAELAPLATPQLTIADQTETSFIISWAAIEGAVSYAYTLNDGSETTTEELSAEFTNLTAGDYTVKVKAVADGVEYLDSEWAEITVSIITVDESVLGQYAITVQDQEGNDIQVVYEITFDGEYRVWPLSYITGEEAYYTATLSGKSLTISLNPLSVNVSGMGTVDAIMCAYHEDESDGNTYLWPEEACVLEFDETGFTTVNGIFLGFSYDNSWYNWTGSVVLPGNKFVKGEYSTASASSVSSQCVADQAVLNNVIAK